MPFGGLLSAGISAGGSLLSGIFGGGAAKDAAKSQVAEEEKALDFSKQTYADQKANQAPYLAAGQLSLSKLMDSINNGTFGPGSVPLPAGFRAPTIDDARNDPGYQFAAQQGSKGILQGAAAAGGAISGGTLKSLAGFNSNLADTTYGNVFNRALSTYNTGLSSYQAALAGQSQAFNQLASTSGLGQTATQSINQTGSAAENTMSNIYSNLGTAEAGGIVGASNATNGGFAGTLGSIGAGVKKAFGPGGQYSGGG